MTFRSVRCLLLLAWAGIAGAQTVPVTGDPVPGLEIFDQSVTDLMTTYHLPGAALGVVHDGKLVLAHGYGFSNQEWQQQTLPDATFRIGSVSKPVTAIAILKLIEAEKLTLDTPAFPILSDLQPLPGQTPDPRLATITIRNLLEHTAGWNGGEFDIVWSPFTVQQAGKFPYPVTCAETIRYMMGRPLDFTPGTQYVYSNFGYCVLGRIVEHVSGMQYADFVKQAILEPAGIHRMDIGYTLEIQHYASEVHYYDYPGEPLTQSVFGPAYGLVHFPYGGYYVESFDSFAGWTANTTDLLLLLTSVNGSRSPNVLESPPAGFVGYIPPYGPNWYWYFYGTIPGIHAMLYLKSDQGGFAVLFNSRPPFGGTGAGTDDQLQADLASRLSAAYDGMRSWPANDHWSQYQKDVVIKQLLNGASFTATAVAPDSWVTLTGAKLGEGQSVAIPPNFPDQLGGTQILIHDSMGKEQTAPLYYVSSGQINCLMPSGIAAGNATLTVTSIAGQSQVVPFRIETVAPALFTANATGSGVPAAQAVLVHSDGTQAAVPVFQCAGGAGSCKPSPLPRPGPGERLILLLYGTGIRGSSGSSDVQVTVGGQTESVLYAGPQQQYPGLDQVNVDVTRLPASQGPANLNLTVANISANAVVLSFE